MQHLWKETNSTSGRLYTYIYINNNITHKEVKEKIIVICCVQIAKKRKKKKEGKQKYILYVYKSEWVKERDPHSLFEIK